MIPEVTNREIEIRYLEDDFIVITQGRKIRLDQTTGLVWKLCDGKNSPWEVRTKLQEETSQSFSENDIWAALTLLYKLDLITDSDGSIKRYEHLLGDNLPVAELLADNGGSNSLSEDLGAFPGHFATVQSGDYQRVS